jgi:hypothetical protein
MGAPLNVFKTYTANLTTTSTTIYTAPTGYTTVVLLGQISNITDNTITVTSDHVRSSTKTNLISNAQVPINDAITVLSGKLVLQSGDSLTANCSLDHSAHMVVSILETANP